MTTIPFQIDSAWVFTSILVSIRIGAALLMTPLLSAASMPAPVRIALVVALSALLCAAVPDLQWIAPVGLGQVLTAVLTEAALGVVLGLGIQVGFAAISVGARLLDVQIGFGIAQVLDPLTRQQLPIVTALVTQVAVLLFFLLDAHHLLLRGLALGLEMLPPGRLWAIDEVAVTVFTHAGGLFALGLMLVAPIVASLLLLELALAVVSRALPQANMFAIGNGVKVLAGMGVMALWAGGNAYAFKRVYLQVFRSWEALFR